MLPNFQLCNYSSNFSRPTCRTEIIADCHCATFWVPKQQVSFSIVLSMLTTLMKVIAPSLLRHQKKKKFYRIDIENGYRDGMRLLWLQMNEGLIGIDVPTWELPTKTGSQPRQAARNNLLLSYWWIANGKRMFYLRWAVVIKLLGEMFIGWRVWFNYMYVRGHCLVKSELRLLNVWFDSYLWNVSNQLQEKDFQEEQ